MIRHTLKSVPDHVGTLCVKGLNQKEQEKEKPSQRKISNRYKTPQYRCIREGFVDKGIIRIFRNAYRKIMNLISRTSIFSRGMCISQSHSYKTDLDWSHLDDKRRASEKQQVLNQQSYIHIYTSIQVFFKITATIFSP